MKKFNFKEFIIKNFSFEEGIDLNDEVEVLYRRNIVIKNIIFVTNLLYSLIILIESAINTSGVSWLWSIILFPITFVINQVIKKIMGSKDNTRQQIASYFCSIYLFASAFLVYLKLVTTGDVAASYVEGGYLLLYFSLVVISFYQDTKMLKNLFGIIFGLMTIIHFTLTHNFFAISSEYSSFLDFIGSLSTNAIAKDYLADIIFRSVILIIFMLALFIITYIGEKMSGERRKELNKRKDIQDDFTSVVTDLYNVILDTKAGYDENLSQIPLLALMSEKLGSLYGFNPERCEAIKNYATFNKDHQMKLDIDAKTEEAFDVLRDQTEVGAIIAKRLQLSQKSENIVRAHLEGWNSEEFKVKMLNMQNEIESQIILLCDIYISLRSPKNFKRPYSHKMAIDVLEREFSIYFDKELFERFIKFNKDFEIMYNQFDF